MVRMDSRLSLRERIKRVKEKNLEKERIADEKKKQQQPPPVNFIRKNVQNRSKKSIVITPRYSISSCSSERINVDYSGLYEDTPPVSSSNSNVVTSDIPCESPKEVNWVDLFSPRNAQSQKEKSKQENHVDDVQSNVQKESDRQRENSVIDHTRRQPQTADYTTEGELHNNKSTIHSNDFHSVK